MSELHKELSRIEFEMRENSMTHTPVENEMRFYEAVKRAATWTPQERFPHRLAGRASACFPPTACVI